MRAHTKKPETKVNYDYLLLVRDQLKLILVNTFHVSGHEKLFTLICNARDSKIGAELKHLSDKSWDSWSLVERIVQKQYNVKLHNKLLEYLEVNYQSTQ